MAAKPINTDRIDPEWPDVDHPLTELLGTVQGNMSPFGEVTFPLENVPYEHPVTEINR